MHEPALCLGLIAGGLFAGSTLYVAAVAHPVRLALGPEIALGTFVPSLRRSERVQPILHVLTLLGALLTYLHQPGPLRLAALLLLLPILPLSLLRIRPLNTQLRQPGLLPADAVMPLRRWGRLHTLRAALGAAGFVLLAVAATHP
jgi:hypothetical protein